MIHRDVIMLAIIFLRICSNKQNNKDLLREKKIYLRKIYDVFAGEVLFEGQTLLYVLSNLTLYINVSRQCNFTQVSSAKRHPVV